jgi:hypothetical protein
LNQRIRLTVGAVVCMYTLLRGISVEGIHEKKGGQG